MNREHHLRFRPTLAVALCSLLAVLGIARPAVGQGLSDRYGVVNDNIVTSQAAAQRMRDGGFGWIRYNLNWNLVNPAPGIYDWTGADREVGFAKAAGLKIYLTVTTPPTWATGASFPNNEAILYCHRNPSHPDCQPLAGKIPSRAAFETFATALVTRYRNDVYAWGFGYEVHDNAFWTGTAAQFVERILVPGYTIVKQIAGTIVAGPDEDVTDSLDGLLQLEATYGRFCDVIAFHILRQSTPDVAVRLDELKAVVNARGQGRPVWLTELGMPAFESDCLVEGIQAEWLRVAIQHIDAQPWVTRIFVYRIANADVQGSTFDFGLLNAVGTSRTAWHVLRSIITGEQPTAYLAEGAAGGFFDLDIAVANPTCATATAKVTFLMESGAPIERPISLPPRTRTTIRADDIVSPGVAGTVAASTVVQSTNGVPLVVERTMFWDAGYYAGHTGSAVANPATSWYFGEGSQGFFDTYVLLANSSASPAKVTVRFLRESGGPVHKTFDVPASSRMTVFAGNYPELTGASFSIVVDSDVPMIAERAMYFGKTPFWSAGHESAGVSAPAQTWYHAEGATGNFFDMFILVGNPNDQVANVTFTYLLESGQVITKTRPIPPQSRLTVPVDGDDPQLANAALSTTVSSDVPVVSERAMYWAGPFTSWYEAHNSFGVTETGARWGLAEGRVGTPVGFETYILLANPTSTTARVSVTFLRGAGQSVACTFAVGPTSRFTVYANSLNTQCQASPDGPRLLSNESFGALIESVDGVPIFAERAMYWNAGGVVWAGGTNATATLLP